MPRWFRRFADIPGITYTPASPIARTSLLGHDATPTVESFTMDGEHHTSLTWEIPNGTTSMSPAKQHDRPDDSTPALLRYIDEVLELPGEASDYHFALQNVIETLWKRHEPPTLSDIERLCWANINLIEAAPEAIQVDDAEGERSFVGVQVFFILMRIYQREGFLVEAVKVAKLAHRFGQGDDDLQELRERLAALESDTE